MPQFRKNKKILKQPKRRKRRAARSTAPKTVTKKVVRSKSTIPPLVAQSNEVDDAVGYTPRKTSQQTTKPPQDIRETSRVPMQKPNIDVEEESQLHQSQIEEIDRIIQTSSHKLEESVSNLEEEYHTPIQTDPINFNGIDSMDEKLRVLEQELLQAQRQSTRLAHEIDLLKAEHRNELADMEKTIKTLRKELHRTAPIHENKFFSLSKELREAVSAIEGLTNDQRMSDEELRSILHDEPQITFEEKRDRTVQKQPVSASESSPLIDESHVQTEAGKTQDVKEQKTSPPDNHADTPMVKQKKKRSGKKKLLTGGVAVSAILVVSGIISNQFFGNTKVDEALVAEYLPEQGAVAGAQDSTATDATQGGSNQSSPELADIPFSASSWDQFEDPEIGVALQYPTNAVKLVKTDNSVTMQRKDGYLFRAQNIPTGLDLAEYWKQIEASSLDYEVEEVTYKGKEALQLSLQDTTDFPGDRYLIKSGEGIIDVWYATQSNKFDEEDMKRVDFMMQSLTFLSSNAE